VALPFAVVKKFGDDQGGNLTTLLTGLGSLSSRSAPFRLANLAASAGVNVEMFLLGFRAPTPGRSVPAQLVVGAVMAAGGYLVSFTGRGDDARSDRSRDADRSDG
jgi:hypothetical protein